MNIELSKQEAWKILDALNAYKKDYAVSVAVAKTISGLEKKIKTVINENE